MSHMKYYTSIARSMQQESLREKEQGGKEEREGKKEFHKFI